MLQACLLIENKISIWEKNTTARHDLYLFILTKIVYGIGILCKQIVLQEFWNL